MIPLRGAELEVSRLALRIQEELVKPLRELDITNKEFACLRAIVFFSPGQCSHSVSCNFSFATCSCSLQSGFVEFLKDFRIMPGCGEVLGSQDEFAACSNLRQNEGQRKED